MQKLSSTVIAGLIVLANPMISHAGIQLTSQNESFTPSREQSTDQTYITKDRIRVNLTSPRSKETLIFRKDHQIFWFIDHIHKTYNEITKSDLAKIKSSMQNSKGMREKMMEGRFMDMTPEQRKQFEKMMTQQEALKDLQTKTTYKKLNSNVKIKKWACTHYEGEKNKHKKNDIWTIDASKLGLSPEHVQVIQDLNNFFEEIDHDNIALFKSNPLPEGYQGIPIKMVSYSFDGKPQKILELQDVQKQDLAPSLFDLPLGYKKEEIPWEKFN
jgi:hypothetical protein